MATGTYKNGVQIDLIYQAAGLLAAAIPVGTVIGEDGAVDAPKSTSLTSQLLAGELTGVAAGRYHGHFTPDNEGRWTVIIQDKNGNGEVSKVYEVAGHDVDSIGDKVVLTSGAVDGIEAGIASQLLLSESGIGSQLVLTESGIASQLLLTKSNLVSSIKADGSSGVASQLLITKSALVSSFLADFAPLISDVESAVDLISSPAIVS